MYHSASNDKRKKKQVEVTTETSPYTTWKSNIKWWDRKAPAFVALHLAPNITDLKHVVFKNITLKFMAELSFSTENIWL